MSAKIEIKRSESVTLTCKACGWSTVSWHDALGAQKRRDEWIEHHSDPKHVKRDEKERERERQKTLKRWQDGKWVALCGKCFKQLRLATDVVRIQEDGADGYVFRPCACQIEAKP